MTGRAAAARAIGRVVRGGAYSNRVIAAESAALTSEERRTAHRIGYGVLRWLLRLDHALEHYSSRTQSHVQLPVWDILRVGAWEVVFGAVPDAIAVDSAVEAVRELGHPRAAGYVNAVLRALVRGGEPQIGDRALAASVPPPVLALFDAQWGEARTDRFFDASNRDAPLTFRARPPGASAPVDADPIAAVPDAYTGPSVPDGWAVQDAASIAVGWLVDPVPGDHVLDMAAAPGGKTLHLLDQGASVTAMDIHPRRLRRAARRVGPTDVHWLIADGRRTPFSPRSFDRILLDAPCTGLGVLRRRPEIKYRVTPDEVRRLAAVQRGMVAEARRLVAPGGRIVYSVCTVTEAETTGIVDDGFHPPDLGIGEVRGNGLQLSPDVSGTDGMFIAVAEAP